MYDSDMAVYIGEVANSKNDVLLKNIEQMKRWAAEGK
jgi:hypothetical protein